MPKVNDPYSRPINATKLDGQMLQGEFYGEKAHDKALHGATGGRAVHQVRAMSSVVPVWPGEASTWEPTTPSPEPTSPSEPVSAEPPTITEDDLFG